MATTMAQVRERGTSRPRPTAENSFYLAILALLWASNLYGFGRASLAHFQPERPDYPIIVHFHAMAFVAWAALFTVQLVLVRRGTLHLHRQLGAMLAGLAAIMLLVSPFAAVQTDLQKLAFPWFQPGFLFIQLGDLVLFGGLVGSALALRRRAVPHKRLMMLAMICLSTAGFGRWAYDLLSPVFGKSFGGEFLSANLPVLLLIGAMTLFDWRVRGRLPRAFVVAVPAIVAMQLFQTWAILSPGGNAAGRAILNVFA